MTIEQTPSVAEPPVHVTFVPTVDDLVHASVETIRGGRRRLWGETVLPLVLGAIVAVQVAQGGTGALFGPAAFLVLALLVLLGVRFGFPFLVRLGVVRQRRQNPHFAGPVEYTFTAEGVRLQTPLGASDMPWASFVRARETPEQILLYYGHKTAYFLPRRALREDDGRRLTAMLAARLGPRAELMTPSDG
jgi:hypothetical protein